MKYLFSRQPLVFCALALCATVLVLTPKVGSAQIEQNQPPNPPPGKLIEGERSLSKALSGTGFKDRGSPMAKMGRRLAELHYRFARAKTRAERDSAEQEVFAKVIGEKVVIDAVADGRPEKLRRELGTLGLEEGAIAGPLVSGLLPIESIPDAAQVSSLQSMRPAVAMTGAGEVTSQGDFAMQSDIARAEQGVDGTGIMVGVMSDTYNQKIDPGVDDASDDIASGDLPPASKIKILDDPALNNPKDEGRAMMQIVRDVAPGATQAFHTAIIGTSNFAKGMEELVEAGADVVVDDIIYLTQPFFQDGQLAQKANEIVKEEGVPYFSAALNFAEQSYSNGFRSQSVSGRTFHDFDRSSTGTDIYQAVRIPVGESVQISFQWTDPYASAGGEGADSDLDLYVVDDTTGIQKTGDRKNVGNDPIEFINFRNDGTIDANQDGAPDTVFYIATELISGSAPERIKYVYSGPMDVQEYDTKSPTSFGHPNAEHAMGVGAAPYFKTPEYGTNPPEPQDFTSEGGTPIYFDSNDNRLSTPEVREKPDVTGPDEGNTTFFGRDTDNDGYPNFPGTSAAAPHVAGLAALMIQENPRLSPSDVYGALEASTIDMDDPATSGFDTGHDFRTGHGLVQADRAVRRVSPPGPPSSLSAQSGADGAQIEWEARSAGDLSQYYIYRDTSATSSTIYTSAPVDSVSAGTTTYQDTGLQAGKTYYYRVSAVDSLGNESAVSNQNFAFLYPETVTASVNRSFRGASGPDDYRLVALPGEAGRPLSDVISGEAGSEWQAYRDDGSQEDFFQKFDGSDNFTFEPGNGFWVTATSALKFEDSISTISLQGDSAATVSLREGWNVISNPTDKSVEWARVRQANGAIQPPFDFRGSTFNKLSPSDSLKSAASGRAYYLFNDSPDRTELLIPYPGSPPSPISKTESRASSTAGQEANLLSLSATPVGSEGPTSTVQVGVQSETSRSVVAPPTRFEAVSLRIKADEKQAGRSGLLMTERRKGDGETFRLQLKSQEGVPVSLSASGLGETERQSVALIRPSAGKTYRLRADETVQIEGSQDGTALRLAVGTEGYVDEQADQVIPDEVTLTSYPNPVQKQATVEYTLPERADVRVALYDVLGRRVATLEEGSKQAGRHQIQLERTGLSSGVYFGRLEAGDKTRTQKITVVR
ncbi:T9SS type A sorting domain-containing protein [Salinibacter ruber]|uniref:T9SS type A sorting domain-containing protein n=1 Tax=Salinibacter ruber TaxID=146919 RepID=UPI00216834FD|nr:T9SS type A sorting domain-containing protein [Salinibacter ruber]MCS3640704.1 hypothetical protein [Salinibacter ruber]